MKSPQDIANTLLQSLNGSQRKAVEAVVGKVRVTAGAGSGKTKTLATRYAYLVNVVGIDPAHILCLTFTNKAAKEMSQRIARLVNRGNVNDYVCTIHGFCVKVLRKEIYRIGFPKSFSILDEDDAKVLAKQVMEERGETRNATTTKQFLDSIGRNKHLNDYVADYIDLNTRPQAAAPLDEAFTAYLDKQMQGFALDFDDLIRFTLHIFQHYPEAKSYWQNELQFVMVDEVQDCNLGDWQLIDVLTEQYNNLFIVGDPDQAIYEWRGSKPELFLEFEPETDIMLNENYRSTENILNTANSIIKNNKKRIDKDLFTHKSSTTRIIHYHGESERNEALWVTQQIKNILSKGKSYADIAILYRASHLTRNIEQALMDRQIPYTIWGGVRFFERKEIKDAISYLKLIDHDDDLAFLRIANVPSRKIGKVFLQQLRALAKEERQSLYATLKRHIDDKAFNKKTVRAFIELIEECRTFKDRFSISTLLDKVLEKSGLKALIRMDEDEDRLENLQELLHSIQYYEETNAEEEVRLETYLQDVALYTNADYRKDSDVVKLMTIHQAKGLEFPCVFIMGLTEGIFPSYRSLRERKKDAEEEERRLMYVAVTRAEEELYLTESEGYNVFSQKAKFPSRFLTEIKRHLFVTEGRMDPTLWQGTQNMVKDLEFELSLTPSLALFNNGDRVKHKLFGEGTIIAAEADEDYYMVDFKGKKYKIHENFLTKI